MAIIWRNRIPTLLKDRGLSLSDLQRKTGMSYTGISRLASETSAVDCITDDTKVGTLKKIAEVLNVNVTSLYEEEIQEELP